MKFSNSPHLGLHLFSPAQQQPQQCFFSKSILNWKRSLSLSCCPNRLQLAVQFWACSQLQLAVDFGNTKRQYERRINMQSVWVEPKGGFRRYTFALFRDKFCIRNSSDALIQLAGYCSMRNWRHILYTQHYRDKGTQCTASSLTGWCCVSLALFDTSCSTHASAVLVASFYHNTQLQRSAEESRSHSIPRGWLMNAYVAGNALALFTAVWKGQLVLYAFLLQQRCCNSVADTFLYTV